MAYVKRFGYLDDARYAALYINGRYWGLYNLREAHSEEQFAARYGVNAVQWREKWPTDSVAEEVFQFAMSHDLQRKPDFLYFSLGDKESLTRNELMKTVAEKTGLLYTHYQGLGINCAFEMNPGNHFTEPERRLAKGICRLLAECGR